MVASIIMIALALAWLMAETDFMRVRLESTEYQRQQLAKTPETATDTAIPEPQAVKMLAANKPILALPAGNPDNYPMTLKTTTKELKALLDQLAKTNLPLTEEVYGYDYSNQT